VLTFRSCWDGVNLDSPNHKSHVAYSINNGGAGGTANGGGECPSSHPVKLPQIMYEIMWHIAEFSDRNMWPTDGSKPFVYAMGLGYVGLMSTMVFRNLANKPGQWFCRSRRLHVWLAGRLPPEGHG
jgi:hypothetical protein